MGYIVFGDYDKRSVLYQGTRLRPTKVPLIVVITKISPNNLSHNVREKEMV